MLSLYFINSAASGSICSHFGIFGTAFGLVFFSDFSPGTINIHSGCRSGVNSRGSSIRRVLGPKEASGWLVHAELRLKIDEFVHEKGGTKVFCCMRLVKEFCKMNWQLCSVGAIIDRPHIKYLILLIQLKYCKLVYFKIHSSGRAWISEKRIF